MSNGSRELGGRIREARKTRNMSQAELAEKLNISLSHMSDIETGKSNFGVDILMRITEVLQISADKLLRTDVPPVNAVYAEEITDLLEGCTPAEKAAILSTLKNMKAAFHNKEAFPLK